MRSCVALTSLLVAACGGDAAVRESGTGVTGSALGDTGVAMMTADPATYEITVAGRKVIGLQPTVRVGADSLIGFVPFAQLAHNWCWAATGQMMMQYVFDQMTDKRRTAPSQCQQRNQYTRAPDRDCCPVGTPDSRFTPPGGAFACDRVGLPEFAKYDFDVEILPARNALPWDALRYQIHVRNTPVAFSWVDPAHMMVAIGFVEAGRDSLVIIRDPAGRYGPVLAYRAGYNRGNRHNVDYYNISYKGP